MKKDSILITSAVLLLGAAASQAAVTAPFQDNFSGGLVNWSTAGDVSVQSSTAVLTTAYSTEQDDFPLAAGALNLSGHDPLAAGGDLENFAGLAPGALDLGTLTQATEGSAMTILLSVSSGSSLSFDWQIATRDGAAGSDYAFLTINGQLITLANAGAATLASSGNYLTETGVAHFEYNFATAGNYTVTIGVTDVGDYTGTTALKISNVGVTVPEAGSSLLVLSGLSLAALRRRRNA